MRPHAASPLSIRLRFSDDARLGPGKIALLEAVQRHRSLARAGAELGMSERRARLLIDSLAEVFGEPVIAFQDGGPTGPVGVSPLGQALIQAFRALEADAGRAFESHFAELLPRIRVAAPRADNT